MKIADIKELAKLPPSPRITEMRADSATLCMLYFGTGTDEFLTIIKGYENKDQLELRKKLKISTEFLFEELLRPADSIWSASGGNIDYGIKGANLDKFKLELQNVRGGLSLRQFMKEIWFERLIVDPNGLCFLTISEDGEDFKLTYKSITRIRNYQVDGIDVDWVLFEPHKSIKESKVGADDGVQFMWFIDSTKYVLLRLENGKITKQLQESHSFGKVPGVVNSSIFTTKRKIKVSPISKQRDLLKSYLIKNSIKEIHQFLHLYPIFWMYEYICPTCKGKRKVGTSVCSTCNGSGFSVKKDVQDVLVMKKPIEGETAIGAPAGYVQPEIATMAAQRTELEWMWDLMFHSQWGTTTEKKDNETATGRFIDIQPVSNRNNVYSDIAQMVETKLMNLIGQWLFPASYKPSQSYYGRRYIIETPDQLMKRYLTAKTDLAPVNMLTWLLEQFYMAEFSNDQSMADFYLKLMLVEPYVHNSIAEVQAMTIDEKLKLRKTYFQEWLKTIDPNIVNTSTVEQLTTLLDKYISKQNIEPVVEQIIETKKQEDVESEIITEDTT